MIGLRFEWASTLRAVYGTPHGFDEDMWQTCLKCWIVGFDGDTCINAILWAHEQCIRKPVTAGELKIIYWKYQESQTTDAYLAMLKGSILKHQRDSQAVWNIICEPNRHPELVGACYVAPSITEIENLIAWAERNTEWREDDVEKPSFGGTVATAVMERLAVTA